MVAKLRGILHEKRIGHAGTLDPMATGVLPVFVGRATRAVEFAAEREKEYLAGLRLGQVTDTQDVTGSTLCHRSRLCDTGRCGEDLSPIPGRHPADPPHVLRHQERGQEAL